MDEPIRVGKQGCPLSDPQREPGNGSRANVGLIDAFRSQKVGVHKQTVEKHFNVARGHDRQENSRASKLCQNESNPLKRKSALFSPANGPCESNLLGRVVQSVEVAFPS